MGAQGSKAGGQMTAAAVQARKAAIAQAAQAEARAAAEAAASSSQSSGEVAGGGNWSQGWWCLVEDAQTLNSMQLRR
jgi:hypothetical protein